ncbi:MAG: recombinase family protein [Desulfamplus sp.]|nr:recombinase family protein [Desulfamplus sp.]
MLYVNSSGIGFDTTTSGGRLVFQIFGALAEFERNLIKERTNAGLKAARARGRIGGRKAKLLKKYAECSRLQNQLFIAMSVNSLTYKIELSRLFLLHLLIN